MILPVLVYSVAQIVPALAIEDYSLGSCPLLYTLVVLGFFLAGVKVGELLFYFLVTLECFRIILCIFCSSSTIRHFSEEPWPVFGECY